ncbi:unnamed protein product [Mesocestoides corti]|uniref:Cystatin domain-containing protein n=1 Tax=Mesocestoides corti TaxID=53468 RepID=A0A0R3U6C2_MESCO|nr:unnamed protein product [Mesocestoides corti]
MAQKATKRETETTGGITNLTPEACQSEEAHEKVGTALKHLNKSRESANALRLVEIVSATKQVTNGFRYVFTVKLSVGGKAASQYKIVYFEKHGKPENPEISLTRV